MVQRICICAIAPTRFWRLGIFELTNVGYKQVSDVREKHYEAIGIGSSYMFRLDDELLVNLLTGL